MLAKPRGIVKSPISVSGTHNRGEAVAILPKIDYIYRVLNW